MIFSLGLALVAFCQARNLEERSHRYQDLKRFQHYRTAFRLDVAQDTYHSRWYLPAIRELVATASFREDPVWIADSLCPRIGVDEAETALETLTEDHNQGELYRKVCGPRANPRVYESRRRLLSRALGVEPTVSVDVRVEELGAGDMFLLCTDGLWGCLTNDEMAEIIAGAPSLKAAVAELVAKANEAGGPDNITAVLVRPASR